MSGASALRFAAAAVSDLAAIRSFVRDGGTEAGLDHVAVDDLVQAVDEVATNVLVHGYQGQPGPLEVEIEHVDDRLVVRLQDEAPPFDPGAWERRSDLEAPWTQRRPGGFGIPLARLGVDEIHHRPRDAPAARGNELALVKQGARRKGRPA